MDLRKTIIGGLCCLTILGGVNFLLNQYGNAGIAIASNVSTSSLGSARQFEGKLDIKNSPYFAQPDIFNMQSNEHLTVLSHYKTKQQSLPMIVLRTFIMSSFFARQFFIQRCQ